MDRIKNRQITLTVKVEEFEDEVGDARLTLVWTYSTYPARSLLLVVSG